MEQLLQRIERYISKHCRLTTDQPIIVGLSGGADSVALLSILVKLGYRAIACHCNFMLRGEESFRDRNHAVRIAEQLGVPFYERTFDTEHHARNVRISIEMAARQLRYMWFELMRQQFGAQAVAVAHHKDDNAETLLLNLIRGTGIAGLTGMKPRNGSIIRPLLCTSREELIAYLSHEQLDYVIDSTNLEALYTRNKIRLEILPLMRNINSAVDSNIERTIGNLRACETVYRHAIMEQQKRICHEKENVLYIDCELLQNLPSPEAFLFETLSPWGFNATTLDELLACSRAPQSGKQFFSASSRAVVDRRYIIVSPLMGSNSTDIVAQWDADDTTTQREISLSYHPAEGFVIPRTRDCACFDADRIVYPLTLRHWRAGDSFIPFGMKGRKKISDYFSDHKFSLIEKENTLLLCDSEKILWIVGERASNEARITENSRRILSVGIEKEFSEE